MGFFDWDFWRRIAIIALCVSLVVAAIVWVIGFIMGLFDDSLDNDALLTNAFKCGFYCFFIVCILLVAYSVVSYIVLGLLSTL